MAGPPTPPGHSARDGAGSPIGEVDAPTSADADCGDGWWTMRTVLQRVAEARVDVGDRPVGAIGPGLLVLVGAGADDTDADAEWTARKIAELRIFEDDDGKMNRSVEETGGSVLVVSQFTLYADVRKGRRPSFVGALAPAAAARLVTRVCDILRARGLTVETGEFGASMDVALVNRGPVTIVLESPREP
jgi:D-aminoacyl-tRNA deacylase